MYYINKDKDVVKESTEVQLLILLNEVLTWCLLKHIFEEFFKKQLEKTTFSCGGIYVRCLHVALVLSCKLQFIGSCWRFEMINKQYNYATYCSI